MPTIGVSPAPADGRSLRSSRTISIGGHVGEARHAVLREVRVEDLAVLEVDRLEERAAEALDDRALDLVAQAVGVDDGAALEGGDDADDLDAAALPVDRDLGAGGDVAALLGAAGDAEAAARRGLRACPSRTCSAAASSTARSRGVLEVLQAERERVHRRRACASSSMWRLAGEVVGGGGERAIRALAQRRLDGVELDLLVGDVVGRARSPAAPEL